MLKMKLIMFRLKTKTNFTSMWTSKTQYYVVKWLSNHDVE